MCKLLKEVFGVGAAQKETILLLVTGHLCSPATRSFRGSSEMSEESSFLGSTVDPEQSWLLQPELLHLHPPAAAGSWEVPWGTAHSGCSRQLRLLDIFK